MTSKLTFGHTFLLSIHVCIAYKVTFAKTKNPAYGQHWTLANLCDSGILILYHESKSIPWVLSIPWVYIYTMSLCLYQESMSITRVHINIISPCPYHRSMSKPVLVNSMHPCLYNESFPIIWVNVYTMSQEIQITEINKLQKYKFKKYSNISYRNTEIEITETLKYK